MRLVIASFLVKSVSLIGNYKKTKLVELKSSQFYRIFIFVNDENSAENKACNCLPECNSIEYEFQIDVVRMINESRTYHGTAVIYFSDDEFVAYRRYETFARVGLLANIGSLLGFFLGFSILSIVETFYFFTLRLFNDLWFKTPSN